MPKTHSDLTKKRFFHAVDTGLSLSAACRKFSITRTTGYRWKEQRVDIERTLKSSTDRLLRYEASELPPPLMGHELSTEAARALDDFGYWRQRYLGRRSTPWQEEAAQATVDLLATRKTEYSVLNMPPGAGKTTLFTHDIPAWQICRDRTIRILLGHAVSRQANTYVANLRRTLERSRLLPAGRNNIATTGVLSEDYGRFKPTYAEAWRNFEFTVMMSIDEDTTDESGLINKEPTVAGYGMESEFLGARGELCIWDDLVTGDVLRTAERIEKQRQWWEEEGQTRVEPGGVLMLLGQRMGGDDLFAYALSQKYEDTDEPRYTHIVFPAHNDEQCQGEKFHDLDSPAYPQGCLLDPIRIPWRGTNGLLSIRRNTPAKYEIQYQQRDVARTAVLVPRLWVDGGRDPDTSEDHPGCWDNFRSTGELPKGLVHPFVSLISVDPSATNFWAIEWWIYHPATKQHFLMDIHNERMQGPDLLDWNENMGVFYGILEDWVVRAQETHAPITHVIVEANACQRWLLQYDHTKRWVRKHAITIIPHATGANKADSDYGVQSVGPLYKFGNIRLPGHAADGSREMSMQLVKTVTRYEPAKPKARPDDCLMAQWFEIMYAAKLANQLTRDQTPPKATRPSWAAA